MLEMSFNNDYQCFKKGKLTGITASLPQISYEYSNYWTLLNPQH